MDKLEQVGRRERFEMETQLIICRLKRRMRRTMRLSTTPLAKLMWNNLRWKLSRGRIGQCKRIRSPSENQSLVILSERKLTATGKQQILFKPQRHSSNSLIYGAKLMQRRGRRSNMPNGTLYGLPRLSRRAQIRTHPIPSQNPNLKRAFLRWIQMILKFSNLSQRNHAKLQ